MTTTTDLPLVPADLAQDVDLALRAVTVGLAVARGDGDRGVLRLKGPNDLVTAVDLATEAAIVGALAAGSSLPVQGEEGSPGESAPDRWVVDPIDGTANFVARLPLVACTTFLPTIIVAFTSTAFETGGGCFVRNATACQAPTSFSVGLHATRPKRTVPGPITTIREQNSSDCPGGETTRAASRRPSSPPCVGTQPSSGWKSCARLETETARKSAYRVVVAPGWTGAPSRPTKSTRTSREVTCASRPPTTLLPPGHVSRYSVVPCAGTTTHGPGTRMHDWMPWHSFVAPPTGANAAATARRENNGCSSALTGTSGTTRRTATPPQA